MGVFYLGPLLGPALGPVIGGALTQAWDWRATQWFLAILCGTCLLGIMFCLPETLSSAGNCIRSGQENYLSNDDLEQNNSRNFHRRSLRSRFQTEAVTFWEGCSILSASLLTSASLPSSYPSIWPVYLLAYSLYGLLVSKRPSRTLRITIRPL